MLLAFDQETIKDSSKGLRNDPQLKELDDVYFTSIGLLIYTVVAFLERAVVKRFSY